MNLGLFYRSTEIEIENVVNGSRFVFAGLYRNASYIRSFEGLTRFWGEEAQDISTESLEMIEPTIREPESELWFSWNPQDPGDAVDNLFRGEKGPPPDSLIIEVGYQDNPWFPGVLEVKRKWDQGNNLNYLHIWEGAYKIRGGVNSVLPYEKLLLCVGAHEKLGISEPSGMTHAGLDIADSGNDTNAYALRKGPLLKSVEEWQAKYLHITSVKAHKRNQLNGVAKMYFDATGIGAGVKSDIARIKERSKSAIDYSVTKYIPFFFGGAVQGGNRIYIKAGKVKILNKDFFSKLNAQAWWNIRLRVENTIRALNGEAVDIDRCFFISRHIKNLEKLLKEMAQCVYNDDNKIKIDKAPGNADSPNLADSVNMAYASDLRRGLRA